MPVESARPRCRKVGSLSCHILSSTVAPAAILDGVAVSVRESIGSKDMTENSKSAADLLLHVTITCVNRNHESLRLVLINEVVIPIA